jgi:hypothetical protein
MLSLGRVVVGTVAAALVLVAAAGTSQAQIVRLSPAPYQVRPYVGPVYAPFAPAPTVYQYRYNFQTFSPGLPYATPYGYGYTPPVVGNYGVVVRQAYSPVMPFYRPTVGYSYYNYSYANPYLPGPYGPFYP